MTAGCPDFAEILRDAPADASIREQVASCFYEEMARTARRVCRDGVLAEDALQEAMHVGLRKLDTYRGDAPLDHWLRRLVTSACNRLRRGRKNDPRLHVPFEPGQQGPTSAATATAPEQEVGVLLGERLSLLAEALEEIPEPNRSLLLLHEGQQEPLGALARRYELTEEAVKSRLKRTRALVRDTLLRRAEAS
jgi:RNA polymerase sigma-70 factor (ECF subfamily)